MSEHKKPTKKTWDLMVGITLVVFGSLRIYTSNIEWNFRTLFIMLCIGYGGYMIFRHFRNASKM